MTLKPARLLAILLAAASLPVMAQNLAVVNGKIVVSKTANGESPLVHGGVPILGVDVWEHSYYIDYRNRRPDYLKAFIENLVNWDHVAEMYDAAA